MVPEVDVLELAADRNAAREPRDLDAACLERLGDHMRRRLAFGGEVGRDDHLLDPPSLARSSSCGRADLARRRRRRAG